MIKPPMIPASIWDAAQARAAARGESIDDYIRRALVTYVSAEKSGAEGGRASAAALTPAQRRARARKASRARWGTRKAKR